ncbi:MAG: hypothetical protein MK085_09470 [Phycisphaerales bacterium]|nr:hypothetical protein [Phycisphaerales bacterium]
MIAELNTRIDERISLLEALESLSQRQGKAIEGRRTDELIRLLARREELTESLLATAAPLEAAATAWKASGQPADPVITEKLARAERLLQQIVERDAADEQAIRLSRGEINEELGTLGRTTAAHRAYTGRRAAGSQPETGQNTFADHTG